MVLVMTLIKKLPEHITVRETKLGQESVIVFAISHVPR